MHDESLTPRAYAKLHADRYGCERQKARSAMYQEHSAWRLKAICDLMKAEDNGLRFGAASGFLAGFVLGAAILRLL